MCSSRSRLCRFREHELRPRDGRGRRTPGRPFATCGRRAAAQDGGRATFSVEELVVRVGELGGELGPFTLRQLQAREAAAGTAVLRASGTRSTACARGVDARAGSTAADGAVLSALRSLAAEDRTVVTRRDVEAVIVAAGIPYSSRAVRAGLLDLLLAQPPVVTRVPGYRYASAELTRGPWRAAAPRREPVAHDRYCGAVPSQRRSPKIGPAPVVGPGADDPYQIVYFMQHETDDPSQTIPGQEFLKVVPATIAARLRAVVIAVAQAPPHKFAGGGKWEAMSGEMAGIYEVRVDGTPNRTHYRLFCVLDTKAHDDNDEPLGALLVILGGASKPFRTEMPDKVYAAIRELRDEYLSRNLRSLA